MPPLACNCWMWDMYDRIKDDELKLYCVLVTACLLSIVTVVYSMRLLLSIASMGFKIEIGGRRDGDGARLSVSVLEGCSESIRREVEAAVAKGLKVSNGSVAK